MRLELEARAPTLKGKNGAGGHDRVPRRRPRLAMAIVIVLLLSGGLGARHCYQVFTVSRPTYEQAVKDLIEQCELNPDVCTPARLEVLMRSLQSTYDIEEEVQR